MVMKSRKSGKKLQSAQLFNVLLNYIVAGMDATSYVLAHGTYFMLHSPHVKAKLEAELAFLFFQTAVVRSASD
ncbi:hypothetical protein N7492_000782 [Penicillium capsulatum]|uniref:Cytochrome P450 n=1 Tax=Penicillium capsulatum TaxID=69766 RepID=A0A9W9IWK4_9EURO|nr:hypothetical protein N7492_000782 [Penicillium capsulatum]